MHEEIVKLAQAVSGAGETEGVLLELLCDAGGAGLDQAAAAGGDGRGLRCGVPLRRGLYRRRRSGGGQERRGQRDILYRR